MSKPIAVDLFSGAGGVTRGLRMAGYAVAAAVEYDAVSAETYKLNNPRTAVFNSDIRKVTAEDLKSKLGGKKLGLLVACPPCQGFTSLTSKHKRDDPRNKLTNQVLRFVRELRPAALMLENVPRFATGALGKPRFDRTVLALERLGYKVSWDILQAADFGTAQHRRRLILYAARRVIDIPEATHSSAKDADVPWRTVKDEIEGTGRADVYKINRVKDVKSFRDWHVVRHLDEANAARVRAAKPGAPRWDLPDHLRPDCHKGSDHGFANVYGRMVWNEPSPTITAGCTSPSKGRFIHPKNNRTISVMEAAMLQDFPADYRTNCRQIDQVCSMIGNAFPARLAAAAAKQLGSVL